MNSYIDEIRKTLFIYRHYPSGPEFFPNLDKSFKAHIERQKNSFFKIKSLYGYAKERKYLLNAYHFARFITITANDVENNSERKEIEKIKEIAQEGREFCLTLYGSERNKIKTGRLFKHQKFGIFACSLKDNWVYHGGFQVKNNICSNCLEPLYYETTICPNCSYELINGSYFGTKPNNKGEWWGRHNENFEEMSPKERKIHLLLAFNRMEEQIIKIGYDQRNKDNSPFNRLIENKKEEQIEKVGPIVFKRGIVTDPETKERKFENK